MLGIESTSFLIGWSLMAWGPTDPAPTIFEQPHLYPLLFGQSTIDSPEPLVPGRQHYRYCPTG